MLGYHATYIKANNGIRRTFREISDLVVLCTFHSSAVIFVHV